MAAQAGEPERVRAVVPEPAQAEEPERVWAADRRQQLSEPRRTAPVRAGEPELVPEPAREQQQEPERQPVWVPEQGPGLGW